MLMFFSDIQRVIAFLYAQNDVNIIKVRNHFKIKSRKYGMLWEKYWSQQVEYNYASPKWNGTMY